MCLPVRSRGATWTHFRTFDPEVDEPQIYPRYPISALPSRQMNPPQRGNRVLDTRLRWIKNGQAEPWASLTNRERDSGKLETNGRVNKRHAFTSNAGSQKKVLP